MAITRSLSDEHIHKTVCRDLLLRLGLQCSSHSWLAVRHEEALQFATDTCQRVSSKFVNADLGVLFQPSTLAFAFVAGGEGSGGSRCYRLP